MKKAPGYYEYMFDGLIFRVAQSRDGDPGSGVNGKWYYAGGENDAEGGNDHFYTKREAIAMLKEYLAHRQYVEPYGWCYVPLESGQEVKK